MNQNAAGDGEELKDAEVRPAYDNPCRCEPFHPDTASAKVWSPELFLCSRSAQDSTGVSLETALVIINTPILRKDIFEIIWKNASIRYCADGGANRLHDAFRNETEKYTPDLIKGDLDSLRDDVKDIYAARGVPIVLDDDQYATDLGKCIKSLVDLEKQRGREYQLVVYGGLSGRLDQTAHTLHTLYKIRKEREWAWVVSEESLTCVLEAGKHELHMPKDLLGPTCGILPIGVDTAQVSSTGLEWNLDNTETSFDTMVSTSNHLIADLVTVMTDKAVMWTAELRKP